MTMYGYVKISFVISMIVVFVLKHFIADFLLQGKYMLGKFKEKGWVRPLMAHCAVHAVFTFFIALYFMKDTRHSLVVALYCAEVDFCFHFIMDRIKASPYMMGRWSALSKLEYQSLMTHPGFSEQDRQKALRDNTYFWWALGFDQMVHALTDALIIYILVTNG